MLPASTTPEVQPLKVTEHIYSLSQVSTQAVSTSLFSASQLHAKPFGWLPCRQSWQAAIQV